MTHRDLAVIQLIVGIAAIVCSIAGTALASSGDVCDAQVEIEYLNGVPVGEESKCLPNGCVNIICPPLYAGNGWITCICGYVFIPNPCQTMWKEDHQSGQLLVSCDTDTACPTEKPRCPDARATTGLDQNGSGTIVMRCDCAE